MTVAAVSLRSPILDYRRRAETAMDFSWMAAGTIGYVVCTLAALASVLLFRSPEILAVLPLSLVAAVIATLIKERIVRCIGIGAVRRRPVLDRRLRHWTDSDRLRLTGFHPRFHFQTTSVRARRCGG